MIERLLAFLLWPLDKLFGKAPKWGDDPKVTYTPADLHHIQALEEARKRRGL